MKNFKKFTAIILTLLISVFSVMSVSAEETYYGPSYEEDSNGPIDRSSFTEVVVPDGTESILDYKSYVNLEKITIPPSVHFMGDSAFLGCDKLSKIYISDLSAWNLISVQNESGSPLRNDNTIYLNGEPIVDLVLPDTELKVSPYAFMNCQSIKSVRMPDAVLMIHPYAFSNCRNITDVKLPDCLRIIAAAAFEGCTGLKTITIPENVERFDGKTFSGCTSLEEVYFNAKDAATRKNYYPFEKCPSIKHFIIGEDVEKIDKDILTNSNSKPTIYGYNEVAESFAQSRGLNYVDLNTNVYPEKPAENTNNVETVKASFKTKKVSLNAGESTGISVTNGDIKTLTTSDKKVALLKNNKLYALKKGTAKVTAVLRDNTKLTKNFTVRTSPKLSKSKVSVKKNSTVKVKITGKSSAVNNSYKNSKKAKITSAKSSSTLKIKGVKKGSSNLTVTVNGVKLKLKVKVK